MGFVEVELTEGRVQGRNELGQFTAEVERACEGAAHTAAIQGASEARSIYAARGYGWAISFDAEGGGDTWNIVADGQWAEAAEFGIPPHGIDTEAWSLYNPEENFPSIIDPRTGKPMQVQHVNHPGTDELRMVETAGDIVASEFEGLLASYLP